VPSTASGASGVPTTSFSIPSGEVKVHGVYFGSPAAGWLIADVKTSSTTDYTLIFSTMDGGATWQPLYESREAS
jgi:hypothetical protein